MKARRWSTVVLLMGLILISGLGAPRVRAGSVPELAGVASSGEGGFAGPIEKYRCRHLLPNVFERSGCSR